MKWVDLPALKKSNHQNERLPFWWEREGYSEQFDWHAITGGSGHGHGH